jgi:prefoldin subunit 5
MPNKKQPSKILEYLIAIAPLINKFTIEDVEVTISDLEKILCHIPGKRIKTGDEAVGTPLNPNWKICEAMRKKERLLININRTEFWDMPSVGVAIPVFENNKVVGGMVVVQSREKTEELLEIANYLNQTAKTLNSTIQQIAAEAQELSATGQELNSASQQTSIHVGETNNVIEIISRIADQTNLIGLNAAIEAARVGEHGRGFKVVAEEVRKLAKSSSESTENTKQVLDKMKDAINQISTAINEVMEVANHQAEALSEVIPAVNKLNQLSMKVVTMAENISNDNSK